MPRHSIAPALIIAILLSAHAASAQTQPVPRNAVQTQGRQHLSAAGWQSTWPGASWSLRFSGSKVGVQLTDGQDYYSLRVDGKEVSRIAPAPGARTLWSPALDPGVHHAQLVKLTETFDEAALFQGFLLEDGTALPRARHARRQIEFIGDSWSAGYGLDSTQRQCTQDEIRARSDITRTYAAGAAQDQHAEAQINAMSGMGVVRNWDGNLPDRSYLTYHPRLLQYLPQTAPGNNAYAVKRWHPQLIVIELGINDFSFPVKPGEPRSEEQLKHDFLETYRGFLAQLKQRYHNPAFVLTATYLYPSDQLRPLVAQLADEERQKGTAVAYVDWQGLELTGCNWHPNAADHQKMRQQLNSAIGTLGNIWQRPERMAAEAEE